MPTKFSVNTSPVLDLAVNWVLICTEKALALFQQANTTDKIYGRYRWQALTTISLGIGQGELGITPLQMANATASVANRGYYITPHIVKRLIIQLNPNSRFQQKTLEHSLILLISK
jgi:cell division protein FtsI/penicillin-binding protein 2